MANRLTILGIIISVGIAVWQYYEQYLAESKGIEVEIISKISLIELKDDANLKSLKIVYKDKEIRNLSKFHLRLKNIGRTSIKNVEVFAPIQLSFGPGTKVIDSFLVNKSPENLNFSVPTNNGTSIDFKFDLLNKGDFADFVTYITGDKVEPQLTGRVENLKQYKIKDSSNLEQAPKKTGVSWWQIAILIVLFLLILVAGNQYRQQKRAKRYLKDNYTAFKAVSSIDDLVFIIKSQFQFLAPKDINYIKSFDNMPELTVEDKISKVKDFLIEKAMNLESSSIAYKFLLFSFFLYLFSYAVSLFT